MAGSTHHLKKGMDFAADPHIALDPVATIFAALFVWTLFGLWLWLDYRGDLKPRGGLWDFLFIVVSGPAAWLLIVRKVRRGKRAAGRRKSVREREWRMESEHWRN